VVATYAPIFDVLHKPWFQARESYQLNGNIMMHLLEGGEEVYLHMTNSTRLM
jgi:hypothetical protein